MLLELTGFKRKMFQQNVNIIQWIRVSSRLANHAPCSCWLDRHISFHRVYQYFTAVRISIYSICYVTVLFCSEYNFSAMEKNVGQVLEDIQISIRLWHHEKNNYIIVLCFKTRFVTTRGVFGTTLGEKVDWSHLI